MQAIPRLLEAFAVITACCTCWLQAHGICKDANLPSVAIALREIRIKPACGKETLEASVHLALSNRSEKAICVLPSEWQVDYSIYYDNDEFDFEGAGSLTVQAPEPKEISDLDLTSVVVAPGATANLAFKMSVQRPKGGGGRLELKYQCRPAYPGSSYRGTTLYRDVLRTTARVALTKDPKTGELLIRPVAPSGCRSAAPPEAPHATGTKKACERK